MAQFRQSNDLKKQAEAVKNLEHGVESWKNLCTTIEKYNKKEWLFHTALPFSWSAFIPNVERDVAIAKGLETEARTTFKPLFNGQNFDGFYTYIRGDGINKDASGVFKIEKDSTIHVSGERFGYFCTTDTFSNFHLKLQFKWGEKKHEPRLTQPRDAGVLYYVSPNVKDTIWPASVECQIQEGDCGDFWLIGGKTIEIDGVRTFPKPFQRIIKKADAEKPRGQWNTVEVISRNGTCVHIVNGKIVNQGAAASVQSGRILFQSEGAELFYKDIQIRRL